MRNLFLGFQAVLPQHLISRLVGRLAMLENPAWLKNLLIRLFMRAYGISLDSAEASNPGDYPHFNGFFTRALKADARPMGEARLLCPADGELSQRGNIEDGHMIQAKGRWFSVEELLGEPNPALEQGSFATVYLSPRDYHRVHLPTAGVLRKTRYIPGELFAVNRTTAAGLDRLFARNERLVCHFDTEAGELVYVMVGAIIVAGIETVWGGVESPQPGDIRERLFDADTAPRFEAGAEIGRFFLGSTVVLLSEKSDLSWHADTGDAVRVLAPLAD